MNNDVRLGDATINCLKTDSIFFWIEQELKMITQLLIINVLLLRMVVKFWEHKLDHKRLYIGFKCATTHLGKNLFI